MNFAIWDLMPCLYSHINKDKYRKIINIRRTKSQNLKDYRLVLQFVAFVQSIESSVKSRMKM